ncbi:MAG TPA: DUF1003 domain-containing protein [Candidatus Nanoarchaeia archaeon]|nr:DUF1003 domain-containing protein [Candidatus Nanoarchaeia archaeon]
MAEKRGADNPSTSNGKKIHPLFQKRTVGEVAADRLALFAGSWRFIFIFIAILIAWVIFNTLWLIYRFDPYPFILLNLCLSTIAALQAPVILMAQNRQAERDRQFAKYDYQVNRKAEREVQHLQKELESIKRLLEKKLR